MNDQPTRPPKIDFPTSSKLAALSLSVFTVLFLLMFALFCKSFLDRSYLSAGLSFLGTQFAYHALKKSAIAYLDVLTR